MKPLKNEYWAFDPYRSIDEQTRIWAEMPRTTAKLDDAPYERWISAGHTSRRQLALHTHRAFAPVLHEYEDEIDRGLPLVDLLAARYAVSPTVIKWLRYSNDGYAAHLVKTFPGHRFALLCHWLNQVYKTERPHTPEALRLFVLGNRFIEWQVGLFGGDTAELAQGIRGHWYWFCVDIGTVIRRTRHLEHRLLAEAVFRWREQFALEVLRDLHRRMPDLTDSQLDLAITPTRQDLRDVGFNFERLKVWSFNLHHKPVDEPTYWLDRSQNLEDRPRGLRPQFTDSPAERADAILQERFHPKPLSSLGPKDRYPLQPHRSHRRRRS
jgi:hypothetical protein